MTAGPDLRRELVSASRDLAARGWVANHDGNVTARAGTGRFLATPTGTAKAQVTDRLLLEVDESGARVSGRSKPFGEINLHLAVYAARQDVAAVVHAHPPYATALAASGQNLVERPFIAEAVVSLGPWIPLVPFGMPGGDDARALSPYIPEVDAVLLQNHGAMAWGAGVEQACLRLELLEHLSKIATLSQATGGAAQLPDDAILSLSKKRAAAGLGAAAEGAPELAKRVLGGAHKASERRGPAPAAEPAKASSRQELTAAIKEELVRVLKTTQG